MLRWLWQPVGEETGMSKSWIATLALAYSCITRYDDFGSAAVWTDPETGLEWQDPQAEEQMAWADAVLYCASLEGGDWRLPTIGELRMLVTTCPATAPDGKCNVYDGGCLSVGCEDATACMDCPKPDEPYWPAGMAPDVCTWTWSVSLVEDREWQAWGLSADGSVGRVGLESGGKVRCVIDWR